MSKNIFQVYQDNPIVTNQATDLMYFGRAPYGLGDDTAMQFSDFAAQFGAAYTPSALTRTNDTNITLTLGGTPNTALLQPVSLTLGWTGLLAIARGGTGVGSVTTVPTATAFAGWDANSNLSANNFLEGTALVTNSGGTTTLTVASAGQQIFSGATFQTVQMPVVATLATGQAYRLVNDSSNALFVISSGSDAILTMQPLTSAVLTFNGIAATDETSWSVDYTSNTIGVQSITGTVNQIIASSPTGNVTLSLPQDIATTSSPIFAGLTLTNPLTVPNGGSGAASFTAYAVLCGGTTSTSPFQSVASVGTSGQVLTSNGPGALPTFQSVPGGGTVSAGNINELAWYAANGTTVSGLTTANSGVLVTSAGGVPSISTTLPDGLDMGTPSALILANATDLPVTGIDATGTPDNTTFLRGDGSWQVITSVTPAALTKTDDTNVTLTLGGTPNTALLQATSLTLGWTGELSVPRGGTGNNTFTAYSVICAGTTATGAFQNVSGVGSAGQVLTSNGAGALPSWQAAGGGATSGTWTPTVFGLGTAGSPTYSSQTGYWTRVGNMVTCWFSIGLTGWGGASGAIAFDGLPVALDSPPGVRGMGTVVNAGNMTNYQPMVLTGYTGTQFALRNGEAYGSLPIYVTDATATMSMSGYFIYQTP